MTVAATICLDQITNYTGLQQIVPPFQRAGAGGCLYWARYERRRTHIFSEFLLLQTRPTGTCEGGSEWLCKGLEKRAKSPTSHYLCLCAPPVQILFLPPKTPHNPTIRVFTSAQVTPPEAEEMQPRGRSASTGQQRETRGTSQVYSFLQPRTNEPLSFVERCRIV